MQIPLSLLNALHQAKGFDEKAFLSVHQDPASITSVRINPAKPLRVPPSSRLVKWSRFGYYLEQRPSFTFDPLFHAGCYYVQEASSMFLEQAIRQSMDLSKSLRVLDLCAAPGGKSTHIQSLLNAESLLISNEVIRSRVNILQDNLVKWGASNVMVTHNDPRDTGRLPHFFDLMVVDAPCSGSGLFRKEPAAILEWSENNVTLCSQRQQRILADAWSSLKPGGILIYSTCSYSMEEDENNFDWIEGQLHAQPVMLTLDKDWGITDTGKGYRFWPDKLEGEGFYLCVFRKGEEIALRSPKLRQRPAKTSAKDEKLLENWMNTERMECIQHENTVYAWPSALAEDMALVLQELRVIGSGTKAGELMHGKLVPDHALALSGLLSPKIEKIELDLENAIRYLQRKDMDLSLPNPGWKTAAFQGHALGWMNVLQNRINNYYPAALRIRKES